MVSIPGPMPSARAHVLVEHFGDRGSVLAESRDGSSISFDETVHAECWQLVDGFAEHLNSASQSS